MARSHPPSLMRRVGRCLERECGVKPGVGLLAAVSGGPDSMALLHVLALLAPRLGFRLAACGVDHGLRPEAAAELSLAAEFAESWKVPFERRAVVVEPGSNLQARARAARYEALRACAAERGLEYVVVAHHRDDRAETVLLRLLRGAGPRGLAVMPARAGDLLRPMIHASRADVLLHLERHRIPCCQDPSNRDARFLRARVRHELLPLLEELSPGAAHHLATLAEQLVTAGFLENSPASVDGTCPGPFDASVDGVRLNREQAAQLRAALGGAVLGAPRPNAPHPDAPHPNAPALALPSTPRGRGGRPLGTLRVPLSRERVLSVDPVTGAPRILHGPHPFPTAGRRAPRAPTATQENAHPGSPDWAATGTRPKQEHE